MKHRNTIYQDVISFIVRKELLSDTVNDLLETKVFKQKEIAKILWISESSLSRMISNDFSIKPVTVDQYLRKLNIK